MGGNTPDPASDGPVAGHVLAIVCTGDGVGWALSDDRRTAIATSGGVNRPSGRPTFGKPGELARWVAATIEDEQPEAVAVAADPISMAHAIHAATQGGSVTAVATLYGRPLLLPMPEEWRPGDARPGNAGRLYQSATGFRSYNPAMALAFALCWWATYGVPLTMASVKATPARRPPRIFQGGAT